MTKRYRLQLQITAKVYMNESGYTSECVYSNTHIFVSSIHNIINARHTQIVSAAADLYLRF